MNVKQRWIAGMALLTVLIVAMGWFLLISPAKKQVSKYNAQAAAEQATQSQLRLHYAMLKSQARGQVAQQALLAKAQTYVPPKPYEPSLIHQLTQAQVGAGVDLSSVTFGNPAAVTSSSAPSGGSGTNPLYTVSVSMTAIGTYFEVEQFLSNVEHMSRSMLLTSVGITPGGSATGSTANASPSSGVVTAAISGEAFMTAASVGSATS